MSNVTGFTGEVGAAHERTVSQSDSSSRDTAGKFEQELGSGNTQAPELQPSRQSTTTGSAVDAAAQFSDLAKRSRNEVEAIDKCFDDALKFFHGGLSSEDKVFDLSHPNLDNARVQARERALNETPMVIDTFRETTSGLTVVGIGKKISDDNYRRGNCQEMSSYAAYKLSTKLAWDTKIYFCETADHAFVITGKDDLDHVLTTVQPQSVKELVANAPANSRAIDVWAGFSSPLSGYIDEFNAKMKELSDSGLRVLEKHGMHTYETDPNSKDYTDNIAEDPNLYWHDARTFVLNKAEVP
jgi:hypothetical protein